MMKEKFDISRLNASKLCVTTAAVFTLLVSLMGIVIFFQKEMWSSSGNELGDFFSGFGATIALTWAIVAVILQSNELSLQRIELRSLKEANESTAEANQSISKVRSIELLIDALKGIKLAFLKRSLNNEEIKKYLAIVDANFAFEISSLNLPKLKEYVPSFQRNKVPLGNKDGIAVEPDKIRYDCFAFLWKERVVLRTNTWNLDGGNESFELENFPLRNALPCSYRLNKYYGDSYHYEIYRDKRKVTIQRKYSENI